MNDRGNLLRFEGSIVDLFIKFFVYITNNGPGND